MIELTSFNQAFAWAKHHKLLLNSLHQLPNGRFVCNWRSDNSSAFYDIREAATPFEACRDALLEAIAHAPKVPVKVFDDFFD